MCTRQRWRGLALCLALLLWGVVLGRPHGLPAVHAAAPVQPRLDAPDAACRRCHQAIYERYERTPMARGSGLAVDALTGAELKARGFEHTPSGIRYVVSVQGGEARLRYAREASAGRPALEGEERLDYFIGSGHRGRTYLYQQDGLWFEVPINWYGKKQMWDMAPAFDNAQRMPDPLPVDPNCLHCHAGEVSATLPGARNRFATVPFHAPGVGCSACHGDPAAHLAHPVAGNLINPDTLAPMRRDSVCLQCHLEGDATVYRPGKSLAAFVPGEDLAQSAVYFVDRTRARDGGRASSQYEALLRSACKRATGDALTCTSCHDPHDSPAPAERVAYFRARCVACHNTPAIARDHHPEQPDCAGCHMPTRKTLDISHEQVTDHDIEAHPQAGTLRARLQMPELVPVGPARVTVREEGLAYAQLAQRPVHAGDKALAQRALTLLSAAESGGTNDAEVHDQLGFLDQVRGAFPAAAAEYAKALAAEPADTTAAANLAVLEAAYGRTSGAVALLRQVVRDDPSRTAAGLNLAWLECRAGRPKEAAELVRTMLRFNPDSAPAHDFLEHGTYAGGTCALR